LDFQEVLDKLMVVHHTKMLELVGVGVLGKLVKHQVVKIQEQEAMEYIKFLLGVMHFLCRVFLEVHTQLLLLLKAMVDIILLEVGVEADMLIRELLNK